MLPATTPPTPLHDAHQGRFLIFWASYVQKEVRVSKPKDAKTYLEQLDILKARGLVVDDEAFALHCLEHHNYYRLSPYRFPFTHPGNRDTFLPGITFASRRDDFPRAGSSRTSAYYEGEIREYSSSPPSARGAEADRGEGG
jgi:hypothetical protein